MTGRKSLKIRQPTADRFERFERNGESQTDALARLLDEAGVPEVLRCVECGSAVQAHARNEDGRIMCLDCAGVDPGQLP
jgi:recombinational DNA repair protein (RecF pathway)